MPKRLLRSTVVAAFALVTFALAACNYTKPWMHIDVVNNSGAEIRNVEVDYPGGSFGLYLLGNEQTHREFVQVSGPCIFKLRMADKQGNQKITKGLDFGDKCPNEISFNVGPNLLINGTVTRP